MCNVFGERAPLPEGGAQDILGFLGCVAAVCATIEYRNYGDHTHTRTHTHTHTSAGAVSSLTTQCTSQKGTNPPVMKIEKMAEES